MLVQAMNTIKSTATAPPLPAMAWDTVGLCVSKFEWSQFYRRENARSCEIRKERGALTIRQDKAAKDFFLCHSLAKLSVMQQRNKSVLNLLSDRLEMPESAPRPKRQGP